MLWGFYFRGKDYFTYPMAACIKQRKRIKPTTIHKEASCCRGIQHEMDLKKLLPPHWWEPPWLLRCAKNVHNRRLAT